MWTIWQRGSPERRTATKLYGRVVAQAREPRFYAAWGVPDSPEGRLEMVLMHTALVLQRLGSADDAAGRLARTLAETFVTDMDDNMRELGVGDLSVPRKVKKAAAALFDRTVAYSQALAEGHTQALEALLARHLATVGATSPETAEIARYMEAAAGTLATVTNERLLAGDVDFPSLSGAQGS